MKKKPAAPRRVRPSAAPESPPDFAPAARPKRHYGWKPQPADHRDFRFAPSRALVASAPPKFSLLPTMPAPVDQGQLGSCGPNSADILLMFDQGAEKLSYHGSSRLFTYYITRAAMGTVGQDSGVDNRTMLKALAQAGYCPDESLWPYDISKFTQQPPQSAYDLAAQNKIVSYAAVGQDLASMKAAILSGFPFLFGFSVYPEFESPQVARTGVVPMPMPGERSIGGHDIVLFGWDDATQTFDFMNPWGAGWGVNGTGKIPYAYATNPRLSGDFWVINAVPGAPEPTPPPGPVNPVPPSPGAFSVTLSIDPATKKVTQV